MKANSTRNQNWIQGAMERYQSPLTRYAMNIVGDLERARDVVQDTFFQLCRQPPDKVRDHLAEWLYTVCRNRAFNVRRKESRVMGLGNLDIETRPAPERDPAQLLEFSETTESILRGIEGLPENQQEVIRLRFQHGFRYKEIAAVTGLSVSNVGFLLHTAIKRLRKGLAAESKTRVAPLRRVK